MSSPSLPKERALMCSLANELLVGQRNAIVARRVLPPNSPFSTTMTFAPASDAVIAATAPAPPQPNTTTSASSSQASLISLQPDFLLRSLLISLFHLDLSVLIFLKKPSRSSSSIILSSTNRPNSKSDLAPPDCCWICS